ncbi:heme-binding protein, partial [Clavibacter michiganensis]|uniref:heme-binding protein n=1 Tax=Clavibacter michiganensis TaxID=28447 RepID=UPI00292D208F
YIRDELQRVRAEKETLRVTRFGHEEALRVGHAALEVAEREELPVVVDVRRGPQVVFHAAREGTTAEHDDWVRRKINTVRLHEVSSYEFFLRQRDSGRVPDWLDPTEYAVAGGSVPVFVAGSIVGTVTVSGIVSSPAGDHDLAVLALSRGT